MRSFFRFLLLVLLIGVGVALAIAVVTGRDPAAQQSPNEVVQALIDSADVKSEIAPAEPGDAAPDDTAPDDTAPDDTAPDDTGEPDDTGQVDDAAAQDGADDATDTEMDPKAGEVNERLNLPNREFLPTINAGAVYITSPAMAPSPAVVPNPLVPYQVPYYPMVANQVPQPATQASADEQPEADPAPTSEPLPAPPDDNAQPSEDAEPQIRRDEGDDSLVINLMDEDIRAVLELLSQYGELNILPSKNVTGKVSATLSGVDVRAALKAILKSTGYVARYEDSFVYVGTPEDFKSMDQAQDVIGTRIYRPNYVTATELQTLILPLLTDTTGTSTVSSPAEVDIPSDSVKTGGDSFANGDVLLVRDYEAVLCQIDQIIEEVDRRPLQVAIEAVILTVNLDDSNRIGVNFELLRDNANMRIISGMPPLNLATIDQGNNQTGGLKIGFLDSSLSMLLEALETVGDTNVVASPKVMCLNKQRAEVHIGEELGYVTTTVTETAATQTVEFLEVGTQLRIRPFISSDGMVRMEIHPELSTGTLRPVQDMTVPDKEVTQVTSNIMCRDGCTVVIGGLIREQLVSNATQIPLFGSLPLFGPAFRQKTEEISRDEIIVLITPQIVHDPFMYAEGEEAMRHTRDRIEVFADKMSPIGTRYYGRRYCRKAQAAWAAGDVDTALRYVNLSIHFDRQNTDALGLRREIVSVCPQADNNVDARLRQGLMPWHHPHVDYSRSGWPSRTPGPALGGEHIMQIEEVQAPVAVVEDRVTDNSPAEDQTPQNPTPSPAAEPEIDLPTFPDEDQ